MVAIEDCSEFEEIPQHTSLQDIELVNWPKQRDTLKELLGVNLDSCMDTNSMHILETIPCDGEDSCQKCSPSSKISSKPIHHFQARKNISTHKERNFKVTTRM